jgi:hypothetical protein
MGVVRFLGYGFQTKEGQRIWNPGILENARVSRYCALSDSG